MLYWQRFLSKHYSTARSPAGVESEDALIHTFIKNSHNKHENGR